LGEVKPGVDAAEAQRGLAIGGGKGWRRLAECIVDGVVGLAAQIGPLGDLAVGRRHRSVGLDPELKSIGRNRAVLRARRNNAR
jgi:hypothetical protein